MVQAIHLKPPIDGSPFDSGEWKEYKAYLDSNGKGDKPAVWSEVARWEMANVHACFFELFERVYLFADYAVENEDLVNYLGFAEVVLFNVYKHHTLEETLYFPQMAQAAGVDHGSGNVAEHHLFDQNLEAAMLYVRFCRQNLKPTPPTSPTPEPTVELLSAYQNYPMLDAKKPFDPAVLRSHLDQIISIFGKHMTDEIETLSKDKIEQVGEKEYEAIDGRLRERLRAYGPEWFLCIAVAAVPAKILHQLLPLPFIVRKVLLPFWWGPKFSAWWKYCPYPQNLTLLGSA